MAFIQMYRCTNDHEFEYFSMGNRASLAPSLTCLCGALSEPTIAAPHIKAIVKGNTDFLEREKERLTKRSIDYDKSKAGKAAKSESIHRRMKAGDYV